MRLRDLLDGATVKVGLASTEKEEAIGELLELLVRSQRVGDRAGAMEALLAREAKQTTGIGTGVAVPHAKHASVTKLTAAMGISKNGVDFDSVDGRPVGVVFLIMAKLNEPGPHIQALAEIARLLQIPGFYRRLMEAKTNDELLTVIASEE